MVADADADILARLDRIQALSEKLLTVRKESVEARRLAEKIQREVALARAALRPAES